MTTSNLVNTGDAIEGQKVAGQSRHPLAPRGVEVVNGQIYFKFAAKFDVRAGIQVEVVPPPIIFPDAKTRSSFEIICEDAVVLSEDRSLRSWVAPGSHTHNTNHFASSKRTGVKVMVAHKEIEDAQRNRQEEKTTVAEELAILKRRKAERKALAAASKRLEN